MTALTAQNGNFTSRKLQNFIAGSLVTVSRSLMNRQDFDLVTFIVNMMAQSMSTFLEKELLVGVGTTAATGLFVDGNVTSLESATTTFGADDMISAQMAIPEAFQGSASWIMNKSVFTSLRKLKDGTNGQYLLNRDITGAFGWSLLGRPVYVSENAPIDKIAYGDYSGLYVKLAQNIEIQILNELFSTSHATGIVGYVEFDSRVVEDQKIAVMDLATV